MDLKNFHQMDLDSKASLHRQLLEYIDKFGGKNSFLSLLEAIRKAKSHPLTSKGCVFHSDTGFIEWNKVIFNEKLQLLKKVRVGSDENGNLLPPKEDDGYKDVLNMVRMLKPIEFRVIPKERKEQEGFVLHAIDVINDDITTINPMFDAVFFSSMSTVKNIMDYRP